MIRYYAYYNHGGYKDFYLGNQEENIKSKFFLPLLAVHEQSLEDNPDNDELRKQVEHQKQLPKLVVLSDTTTEYNYPKEARILMSHGGYKILYKRLDYRYYALAIRDIAGPKDVYGRQSPFNMMFIGEAEDMMNLDKFAEYIRNNYISFLEFISTLFVNDLNENGLRCDIERLTSFLHSIIEKEEPSSFFGSSNLPVRLLVVPSLYNLKTTLKEQDLNRRDICICFDEDGNRLFKKNEEQPNFDETIPSSTRDKENVCSQSEATERKTILSLHAMTNTPKLEDIKEIWDYIRGLEKKNVQMSKRIEELEKRITELENKQNHE